MNSITQKATLCPRCRIGVVLLLLMTSRAFALDATKSISQFNCQTWSQQNGLPANGVNAIAQTEDGCIWLGVVSGLLRFDGIKFTVVGMQQSPDLRNTQVLALAPASGGGLWFGLKDSAYGYYDGRERWFLGRDALGGTDWLAPVIIESKDGRVWIGGNRAGVRPKHDSKVRPLFPEELRALYVNCLLEDSHGGIWAGTGTGLLYLDPNQKKWLKHPDAELESIAVTALAEDREGGLWVGTPNGLLHYDAQGRHQSPDALGYSVGALLVDRQGVLWAGTQGGGLCRYYAGIWTSLRKTDGLADDNVNALAEDREGSLWIGTRNGLSQLMDVKLTTFGVAEGIPSETVISVSLSPRAGVWAATHLGVSRFEGQWVSETYSSNSALKKLYVKRACEDRNGDLYVVNGSDEINIFNGGKWVAKHPVAGMPVAMMEDSQGMVGSAAGEIFRVGRDYLTPYQFTNGIKPDLSWVNNMMMGRDGSILVASVNGICRIKGGAFEQWTQGDGLADYNARWVSDDADGTLWVGLATGIARVRGREIRNIHRENGLFDANISAMIPDDRGNFWVDSNRGIFRVSRASLNAVADGRATQVDCVSFDGPDAVKPADKYEQERSGCRTADGYIWFPSSRGLIRIDPAHLQTNTVPPPVHVERVRANGKEVAVTNGIVVPPGPGELEFHYVAFSYISPQRIRFRYQLEGYDQHWVEAGDRRLAVYNNLKPGRYTFRVTAANADGVWNETGDSLTLELRPHFQETVWFYLLCAGLGLAALGGSYGWRVRHLRNNQLFLQAQVQHRTAELAETNTSLHHEITARKGTEVQLKQRTHSLENEIEERKRMELEIARVHRQLVDASRRGGMAEIATNVLHNVGNVLNSVNVSTGLLAESVKKSKASRLARVVVLMQEHAHDLGEFVTHDVRGRHLPAHLAQLSEHLLAEETAMASELDSLRQNVDHIKEIVAMQQSYATFGGVKEIISVVSLVEDGLRMHEGAFRRHGVEVIREFETVPPMNVEKHKILQILVNLLRNAKHACQDSAHADKRLTVRVANGDGQVKISVMDNGVGIPPENLTRIFNHGFTTRKEGHGFGLHSGALAAREMGGSLTVHSDGLGRGATFTLELPLTSVANKALHKDKEVLAAL